jgi:hypothetical protein
MQLSYADAKVLISGIIPRGFDARTVSDEGKKDVRAALEKILELTKLTRRK